MAAARKGPERIPSSSGVPEIAACSRSSATARPTISTSCNRATTLMVRIHDRGRRARIRRHPLPPRSGCPSGSCRLRDAASLAARRSPRPARHSASSQPHGECTETAPWIRERGSHVETIPRSCRSRPTTRREADRLRRPPRCPGAGPAARRSAGRLRAGAGPGCAARRLRGPQAGRPRPTGAGHGRDLLRAWRGVAWRTNRG